MKIVDLNTMSIKQFIVTLSGKFGGVDLSSKKKFIKATITEIVDTMGGEEEDDGVGDSSSSEEEAATKKKKGGGGGLSAIKEISPQLSAFLGFGTHAARTDVVKGMWEYIREHNLQDPSDKRQIILDDKMKGVFGDVDSFSMFTMNKYISPHIHPFKPLDLTPSVKKRNADDDGSGRKKKKKKQKKKAPGMQPPYRLSDDLVAVVGKSILPRPQVTQALWKYIRENDLQVRCLLIESLCCLCIVFVYCSSLFVCSHFISHSTSSSEPRRQTRDSLR